MGAIETAGLILDAAILDLEDLISECFTSCVKSIIDGIKNNPEEVREVLLFGPCKLFEGRPEYDFLATLRTFQTFLGVESVREIQVPDGLSNDGLVKFCAKYRTNGREQRIEGVYSIYLDHGSLYSISGLTGRYRDVKRLENEKGYFGK